MGAPAFVSGLAAASAVSRRGSSRAALCRRPASATAVPRRALRMEGSGEGGAGGEGGGGGGGGEGVEARRERFRVRRERGQMQPRGWRDTV